MTMCGSGMTACWIPFVANLCGEREVALYDVSNSEGVLESNHIPFNCF